MILTPVDLGCGERLEAGQPGSCDGECESEAKQIAAGLVGHSGDGVYRVSVAFWYGW